MFIPAWQSLNTVKRKLWSTKRKVMLKLLNICRKLMANEANMDILSRKSPHVTSSSEHEHGGANPLKSRDLFCFCERIFQVGMAPKNCKCSDSCTSTVSLEAVEFKTIHQGIDRTFWLKSVGRMCTEISHLKRKIFVGICVTWTCLSLSCYCSRLYRGARPRPSGFFLLDHWRTVAVFWRHLLVHYP